MVRNARGHGRRVGGSVAVLALVALAASCAPNPRQGDAATTTVASTTPTVAATTSTTTTSTTTTSTTRARPPTTMAAPSANVTLPPAPPGTTGVSPDPVLTHAYVPHVPVVLAAAVVTSAAGRLAVAVPDALAVAVLAVRAEWSAPTTAPLATITVWPGASTAPVVASLSAPPDANALSGRVTVPVGGDHTVAVQAPAGATVSVTLVGGYAPVATATAGRFVPVAPTVEAARTFGRGQTRRIAVPDAVAADAVAVAVRVTTDGAGPGAWTVVPGGSSLDGVPPVVDDATPGPTAMAVVPLDGARVLDVRSSVGGHARVDVVGWFTGPSAEIGTAGLYVPRAGSRLLDTRRDVVPVGAGGRAVLTLPADVLAAEVGVVAREPLAAGRVAIDGAPPAAYGEGHPVVAPALAVPDGDGRVIVRVADGAAHLTFDVAGVYVRGTDGIATLADRVSTSVGTVEGRFPVPLDAISATAVPPEVIQPTSEASLDGATNPINGKRSTARPTTIGYGCTVDVTDPRPCLVAMLDVLGFDAGGVTALDRQTRLQQAVAVVQLDAGLPATGRPDDDLYRYLGIAPGTDRRDAAEVRTIGTTRQGRPITALRYGSAAKVVLVVAQTHGDEEAGLRVWLRARLGAVAKDVTLWVVPMANPDGVALDTRFLPGGHDPNRKAPSEPEQQAVYDFALAVKPVLAVYYHQNYGWIGGSGASMDPARDYFLRTKLGSLKRSGDCALGFLWCPVDEAAGSSSILVELPDVVTPDDVQRHAAALLAVAADVAAVS